MGELFIERLHAHCADSFVDQVADWVVNHRRRHACLHLEAVSKVCCAVEFSTAHMNRQLIGFTERNNSRIEPMNEGTQRDEIQGTRLRDVEH